MRFFRFSVAGFLAASMLSFEGNGQIAGSGIESVTAQSGSINVVKLLDDVPMINPASASHKSQPTNGPIENQISQVQVTPSTVEPTQVSPLREEDRVGAYQQPVWTTQRRFPGVRTYVIPENTVEFEYWTRADIPRPGKAEVQHMFEFEFGLPNRFQLDLYGIARTEGGGDTTTHFDQQIEIRYAFADWNQIWGNPTLYLEYANRDQAPDKIEAKLLIGGEISPGWHWGQNFLFEGETGGEREYEYGWTGGVAYTLVDQKLSVGLEAQFSLFDLQHHRGHFRDETFVGPSIQYRPSPRIHLDLAPLFGVDYETPAAKLFFVFGYEF